MTRAKEKEMRKVWAITARAGQALRTNDEQVFLNLFPHCDVGHKFVYKRVTDGEEVECDLFSAACYGIANRKKDDLARVIAERMIQEGLDLRLHRVNTRHRFSTLMMAAACCETGLVEFLLPHSDLDAITTSESETAAELADGVGKAENAELIRTFQRSRSEAQSLGDDIPVPKPTRKKSIDD